MACSCNAALPLNAKDVGRFFQLKEEHYRNWKTIGAELGVGMGLLCAIEKDHPNDANRLQVMIDSANPAPTHGTMAKILQSANINKAVAGIPAFTDDVWLIRVVP